MNLTRRVKALEKQLKPQESAESPSLFEKQILSLYFSSSSFLTLEGQDLACGLYRKSNAGRSKTSDEELRRMTDEELNEAIKYYWERDFGLTETNRVPNYAPDLLQYVRNPESFAEDLYERYLRDIEWKSDIEAMNR